MEFVEQLKSSVDIVNVVSQYVPLKRVGASPRYMGKCPFHTEKTASFSVHSTHQFYKCFGCGVGGDVIKFVMEIEGLSFYEALTQLAERHGIPMPKKSEYSDPETKLRAAVFRMHEIACEIFQAALAGPVGAEARAYLRKRALTQELVEQFGLGYSERGGQVLVRAFEKERFDAAQLEASGLVRRRQDGSGFYDAFRNRLMFPIHGESGKIIGFGGRALTAEDEPKYLNSPETPVYKKSYVMYNLNRARDAIRKNQRIVLVEGYMDVIGAWTAGVHEAVATCGTALTVHQVKIMRRHTDRIVVNFDGDAAGVRAAEKSLQTLLEESMRVRVLELEGGLDPDEYVREHGAEAYQQRIERAPGYFHWLADRARAKYDTSTAEGKIQSLQFLLPAIQRLSDRIERAAVANDVATYLGVEQGLVLEYFRKSATERSQAAAPAGKQGLKPLERILLSALIVSPEARAEVLPQLKGMPGIQQFATRKIFQVLFTLFEAGSRCAFADIDARLEDQDKDMLASIAFAEDHCTEEEAMEQARACVRKLGEGDVKAQVAALRARVKEAEMAHDFETVMRLARELDALQAGLKSG